MGFSRTHCNFIRLNAKILEMAEGKESSRSSFQDPEWKNNFSPGPSEEELKRAQGPTSETRPPEIYMQVDKDKLDDYMLREGFVPTETGLERVADTLKKIEEAKDKKGDDLADKEVELKEIRERMERQYEALIKSGFSRTEEILEDGLLRFQNPYPYDSRYGAMWFKNLQRGIEDLRTREWVGEESEAWLDRIEIDVAWAEANFKLLECAGPLMVSYYDGKGMMQWLRKIRSMVTASDYQAAFSKELLGLGITEEQKKILRKEAKEGVRERAVEYQDQNHYWRIALGAAAQWDYAQEPTEKSDLFDLNPAELYFINLVFRQDYLSTTIDPDEAGDEKFFAEETWIYHESNPGRKFTPNGLLNWGTMKGSAENKKRYFALMESLLLENAQEELQKTYKEHPDGERSYDEDKLRELAIKIEKRAESILAQGLAVSKKDIGSRLAGIVVRSGVGYDWLHMTTPDLGCVWKYKEEKTESSAEDKKKGTKQKDKKEEKTERARKIEEERPRFKGVDPEGNPKIYVREGSTGSLYSALDITTPVFWSEHTIDYDKKARSRTELFPPTSPEFRLEVEIEKPGWEKDIMPYYKSDPVMRDAFSLVGINFENYPHSSPAMEQLRESEFNGGLDEGAAKALRSMVWAWETPFESGGERIAIPIFLPAKLKTINFFKTVTTWKDKEDAEKAENWQSHYKELKNKDKEKYPDKLVPPRNTIWEDFVEDRKLPSEIEWDHLAELPLDGWQVSMLQMEMWLKMALDPVSKEDAEKFFDDPAQLKEFIKRVELGGRDEKVTYVEKNKTVDKETADVEVEADKAVFELAVIPMYVAFWLASKHKLLGSTHLLESELGEWRKELGEWMREMEDLPSKKGKTGNYNYSMSAMTLFYSKLLARAGNIARKESEDQLSHIQSKKIKKLGL